MSTDKVKSTRTCTKEFSITEAGVHEVGPELYKLYQITTVSAMGPCLENVPQNVSCRGAMNPGFVHQ
ncbi:hypothetical protein XELAEV_18004342mg [Xenopus laevis]|uniref:Uncharacterized protein n=1 Tax=Xenopus laevis TaxID=8355 RepID=A0A974BRI1_XENLA|nr:hypothetical protein XELAEV_18003320mg [Xenopus laevis]OCT56814.1 hypothetical protein XELAEV_18004342mg [Xenopus laevis]